MAHAIFIWIVGFASWAREAICTLSLTAPVLLHQSKCTGNTVPLQLSILKVLKKRGRDNEGSARSNREYKNNHIAFDDAHNLCAVVNQQAWTPIDCMPAMQKMHGKVVDYSEASRSLRRCSIISERTKSRKASMRFECRNSSG